jgi:hypothetical protein
LVGREVATNDSLDVLIADCGNGLTTPWFAPAAWKIAKKVENPAHTV